MIRTLKQLFQRDLCEKELRPSAKSHVNKPSQKQILQPQSNLHMTVALDIILPITS